MSSHDLDAIQDLLDGRLALAARVELEAHLAACEACRAEYRRIASVKAALRAQRDKLPVPDELERAVLQTLDAENAARAATSAAGPRPRPARRRLLAGLAAAVAAAALGVRGWRRLRRTGVPALAARDQARVVSGALPLEWTTSDAAGLDRAFKARALGFPPRVLDLAMMGFSLDGGRVHSLDGRTSALFVYRNRAGRRLVCQMYRGRLEDLPPAADVREQGGFRFHVYREAGGTVVFWQEGAVVCVLAGDLPAEDVVALAVAKAMLPA